MKAIELCKGNHVCYQSGKSIFDGIIKTINTNNVTLTKGVTIKFENLLPVRITEDWLISFGFIKSEITNNYWLDFNIHYLELIQSEKGYYPIYCQVPEYSHEDEQMVNIHNIIYVHELQNLCYWLTRNELKLLNNEYKNK